MFGESLEFWVKLPWEKSQDIKSSHLSRRKKGGANLKPRSELDPMGGADFAHVGASRNCQ